jgi:probable F420-dependent oxidoreductase
VAGEAHAFTLEGTGIWSRDLRYGDPAEAAAAAAEIEELGYSAVWLPDVGGNDLFESLSNLLAATERLVAAAGVLNVWLHSAEAAASGHATARSLYGRRLLPGFGVGHAPFVDRVVKPGTYRHPIASMRRFLEQIDSSVPPVPASDRVLAALGPKMLSLARTGAAGTHSFLMTPQHTRIARDALGPGALVAPEQTVVLERDASAGRALVCSHLAPYLRNYSENWKRLGFTDADFEEGGSDRLVNAIVAVGDEAKIAERIQGTS